MTTKKISDRITQKETDLILAAKQKDPLSLPQVETIILNWVKPKPKSDREFIEDQITHDKFMLSLQKRWRNKYASNVYVLNENALTIQHWFFRCLLQSHY